MAYTADDIVGLTLFAARQVKMKKLPQNHAPIVGVVEPGAAVGVVYSWLEPTATRTNLHWMFYDPNGTAYYVEHTPGAFDLKSIQQQIEKKKGKPDLVDRLSQAISGGFFVWGIFSLTKAILD